MSILRARCFVVIASLLMCVGAMAEETPAVKVPLALNVLPARTILALVLDDTSQSSAAWRGTQLAKFTNTPEVSKFLAPASKKLDSALDRLAQAAGMTREALSSLLPNSAVVGVVPDQPDTFAIAAYAADDQAADALAKLMRMLTNGKKGEMLVLNGQETKTFSTELKNNGELTVAHQGNWLIGASNVRLLEECYGRVRTAAGSFGALPSVTKILGMLGAERDATVLLNVDQLRVLAAKQNPNFQPGRPGATLFDSLALTDLHMIGVTFGAKGKGFSTRIAVVQDTNEVGLHMLLGKKAVSMDVLKALPYNTTAVEAVRLRPDQLLPIIRHVSLTLGDGVNGVLPVEQVLGMIQGVTQVNLELQILNNMEGSIAVAMDTAGPAFGWGGISIVARVKDTDMAKTMLANLARTGKGHLEMWKGRKPNLPININVKQEDYHGSTIHYLSTEISPIGLALFARDNTIVITTSLLQAHRSILALESGRSMADNSDVLQAFANTNMKPGIGFVYARTRDAGAEIMDISSIIVGLQKMVMSPKFLRKRNLGARGPAIENILESLAADWADDTGIDLAELPDPDLLNKHLFDTTGSLRAVDGGFVYELVAPLPFVMVKGSSRLVMGISLLIPFTAGSKAGQVPAPVRVIPNQPGQPAQPLDDGDEVF